MLSLFPFTIFFAWYLLVLFHDIHVKILEKKFLVKKKKYRSLKRYKFFHGLKHTHEHMLINMQTCLLENVVGISTSIKRSKLNELHLKFDLLKMFVLHYFFRYAFTVASNITIYTMTWVTLGVAGASQQIVGPENAPEFRVCSYFINIIIIALY